MPVNSRQKGARGEREFSSWITDKFGIKARRGVQFQGGSDSSDIVCDADIHFEVKRVNTLNVHKALDQAIEDAGSGGKVPVVASRRDRGEWLFHLRAKDATEFARAMLSAIKDEEGGHGLEIGRSK